MLLADEFTACAARFDQPGESWLEILLAQPHLRVLLLQDKSPWEHLRLIGALRGGRLVLGQLMSPLSRVHEHAGALRAGICLPLGSSDFVRACMRAAGIDEPRWNCYPRALLPHMLAHPRKVTASAALQWAKPVFVKPAHESLFRAFVLREDLNAMTRWDKAQLERLLTLPRADPVWVSQALPIAAEWRYYILNGEVIGYTPTRPVDPIRTPGLEEVSSIIAAAPPQGAFALDVAVLKDGRTTLLCARDAWSIEWYPFASEAPDPLPFLNFLWARWSELLLEQRRIAANSSIL